MVLQQALHQIPSPATEVIVRNVSQRLAQQLLEAGAKHLPEEETVRALIKITFAAAAGNLGKLTTISDSELCEG